MQTLKFQKMSKPSFAQMSNLELMVMQPRTFEMGGVIHDNSGKEHSSPENKQKYKREAIYFTNELKRYLNGEVGLEYLTFLKDNGMKPIDIVGSGSLELPDRAIAATIRDETKGIIVSNGSKRGFYSRASDFAAQYNIPVEWAKEYILAHEVGHAHQPVMEEKKAEYSNELMIHKFYSNLSKNAKGRDKIKYESLSRVALDRSKKVELNYGRKAA